MRTQINDNRTLYVYMGIQLVSKDVCGCGAYISKYLPTCTWTYEFKWLK